MVILLLQRVSASFRGELSRWMIEPQRGVFVGSVSGMVRDRLWDMACLGAAKRVGGAMMLYDSPTEQGFRLRTFGDTDREIVDCEGLFLVRILSKATLHEQRYGSAESSVTQEESTVADPPAPLPKRLIVLRAIASLPPTFRMTHLCPLCEGISRTTIKRVLTELAESGYLASHGEKRTASWERLRSLDELLQTPETSLDSPNPPDSA
jgi:CRISPR-associated protein Cas2